MPQARSQARRASVGSAQSIAAALDGQANPPQSPVDLTADEQVVWNEILRARSNAEWQNGIDRHIAAQLAQAIVLYRMEWETLIGEGTVLTGIRGGLMQNPRFTVCQTLRGSILSMQSRLRLSLVDDVVEGQLVSERREAKMVQNVNTTAEGDADDLIPRPRPTAVTADMRSAQGLTASDVRP